MGKNYKEAFDTSLLAKIVFILIIAGAYFGLARLGMRYQIEGTNTSPVWPSSGIAFAALLILGIRAWPGIFLGALIANYVGFLGGDPPIALSTNLGCSALIAVGNTFEGLFGVLMVGRLLNGDRLFNRPADVFRFVSIAFIMCMVAATVGASALKIFGITNTQFFGIWFTWWLGDLGGILTVTPLLWCYLKEPYHRVEVPQLIEIGLIFSAVGLLGRAVLMGGASPILATQEYLLLPLLLWAVFRFGRRTALTAVLFLSGMAILATVDGIGPFYLGSTLNESLLALQTFICTMALIILFQASALSENETT